MLPCYVVAIVTTNSVLRKNWRCRKCQKGYCRFGQVLGHDRGFLVATEFLVLCCNRGFHVLRHGSQAVGICLVAT